MKEQGTRIEHVIPLTTGEHEKTVRRDEDELCLDNVPFFIESVEETYVVRVGMDK